MSIGANDMQSYKIGDDEFDEHDIFSPPTNEEVIKEKYDNLYDSSDEDDTLDENIAFYCDIMSVGTIDDVFVMPTTYCNDHDWGDNYDACFDLENLFESHDEYVIDNNVCNTIESGFGRVSTLGKKNPTTLENIQSYEIFDKSGFGEVMTLVNDNPTIMEDNKICMHVDHKVNVLYDSYIVEFDYDPTCNYLERGKYGYRNFQGYSITSLCARIVNVSFLFLAYA